ncbi:MAG TPA: OmpA family protein, partial [Kofleriaceae bacterium]
SASQSTPAAAPAGSADRSELDRRNAAADELAKQLAKTANITVAARRGLVVLTLAGDALFATGTSELSDAGKIAVTQVGAALKHYTDRRFLITGHTDDAKAPKDNWDLSTARAVSVARYLVQGGVDGHGLIAGGAGDGDPIKDAARNHRIEIAMLPSAGELAPLPSSLGPDTARVDAAPAPVAPVAPAPAPAPAK